MFDREFGRVPFLGRICALSGVAGDQVALFPHPASRGAPCGRTRGFRNGLAARLRPKFHSIPRNLHGKVGLAWRASKCLH